MATRKKPLTTVELAEINVKQLKTEVNLNRMKTSLAIKDLTEYIEAHQNDDHLVIGFENSSRKNPFRKKKLSACRIF